MKEFEEITTPEELSKYMEKNIHFGFVGKNKKIYDFSNFSESWA